MSFKEINMFALFFIILLTLIGVYVAGISIIMDLITFSNWFALLLIGWVLAGLYGLIIAVWSLIEWSANI